ncbi:HIT domain-containing protein [Oceanispirochaeta crateris]|jgi:histidine triad (HIT) family protein|uniref:HIT domain-containing protein n=1 Tax=Oceanispirochaeta crateris TaxID=2518645 RepID=A0A5C1QJ38_9SPIO|nr:HIT domain-containing protein [Oceanispirochaeta crateris]QEN07477.1 HIT domain-containing protein [Oceanispirochaeta crateris]
MEETIFDKIIAGQLPSDKVYEDENVLAFRDINPQAPVHVLVVPKKKVKDFIEIQHNDVTQTGIFFNTVSKVASLLGLEKGGYRIVLNCGEDGQQTVEYLHAHILGDRKMNWPPG